MQVVDIAYFTSRKEPRFEWFYWSLVRQLNEIPDLIARLYVIDYHAKERSLDCVSQFNSPRVEKMWVSPKPCVWQGEHRLTKSEYFAASNARNTALALCKGDYLLCVDDLSVLCPGWLTNALHAKEHGYVALGAYRKVKRLQVENGEIKDFDFFSPGNDSRLYLGSPTGAVPASGNMLFGCSFGVPMDLAEKVNGFDEICDAQGAEDYDFGIRLERAGAKIMYNMNMMTYESEELHHVDGNQKFIRQSKLMEYNHQKMGSDHVLLNRLLTENRITTIADHFNLAETRKKILSQNADFDIPKNPQHDWRDGTPLSEM